MFTSSQPVGRDSFGGPNAFWAPGAGLPESHMLLSRRATAATKEPDACSMLRLQPVHSLHDGMLYGADVTLGRADADRPPADGPHMTNWLLYAACVQGSLHDEALPMSVALPPGTRLNAALVAQTESALDRSGTRPGLLTVVLGERAVHNAGPDSLLALSALRDTGAGVAVEVGEAASGMRALCRLPVTCLRLQSGLVADLPNSRLARDAVDRAVEIAHALSAEVIAVGVLTALQRDILADLGVDAASGPVFGPALPAPAFRHALHRPLHV